MLLPDTVAAFITEDLTGQVIPVKLYWQITFVTEGQALVTSGLKAVIVAAGWFVGWFRAVCPGLPAVCRDGCERGLV